MWLTFVFISLLDLVDGVNGADMNAVQNVQQDLSQTQQVTEVIKTEVDEVPCQVYNLQSRRDRDTFKDPVQSSFDPLVPSGLSTIIIPLLDNIKKTAVRENSPHSAAGAYQKFTWVSPAPLPITVYTFSR